MAFIINCILMMANYNNLTFFRDLNAKIRVQTNGKAENKREISEYNSVYIYLIYITNIYKMEVITLEKWKRKITN